jgi:tRNA modification GTPase
MQRTRSLAASVQSLARSLRRKQLRPYQKVTQHANRVETVSLGSLSYCASVVTRYLCSAAQKAAGAAGTRPTIYALATAPGTGAIAVFRISGPETRQVLQAVLHVPAQKLPQPRQLVPRTLYDPQRNYAFDRGMVVWFPAPASYTGEDMAELQVHGAPAVVRAALVALAGYPGLVPATAGAFTKRALTNGKMDRSQVEALAHIIQADSLDGLALAVNNLQGALRSQHHSWRAHLHAAMAIMEAVLEFGEEHLAHEVDAQLEQAAQRIRAVQAEMRMQIRLASPEGQRPELSLTPRIVLYGRVNAGKSSLFNLIGQREASIVHETPGTTRDVVEQRAYIDGLAATIMDTAGLRETPQTASAIEAEGIRRARKVIEQTPLRVLVVDASTEEECSLEHDPTAAWLPSAVVLHKADLVPDHQQREALRNRFSRCYRESDLFFVSSRTGEGVDAFLNWLGERLRARFECAKDTDQRRCLIQTQRQHALLRVVHDLLDGALQHLIVPELAVEHLRSSLQHLAEISGEGDRRFDAEDTLEHIFSRFCIGK